MNSSSIKSLLYQILLSSLILYVTFNVFSGIQTSGEIIHWLLAFALFGVAGFLVKQTLKFFTLPSNFFTYFLASALIGFGAIFAMSMFLPGIQIGETLIKQKSLEFISINSYTLSPVFTMIAASAFSALLSASFYELKKG
ncbi:phage holin family protein [Candidatus Dojkabacteria bacterium]|nr:phage holin family protein [Candidatus Dojkabacteria bacterium]